MSAREMWAPKEWREVPGIVSLSGRPQVLWSDDVRVLVQEIPEGRPEFGPGDKVRYVGDATDVQVVEGVYVDKDGQWCVAFERRGDYDLASEWGKLPPETSRLIRVTGPEAAVRAYVADAAGTPRVREDYGVRVEVVDDE